MKIIFLAAGLSLSAHSWAMSRLYDYDAAAVLKNGQPCFYLTHQVEEITPGYLQGQGVRAAVYAMLPNKDSEMWSMWMKNKPATAPTSPASCMMYGTRSPDKNHKLAAPLRHDEAYSFALMGEYGRNMVYFCIKKDAQGKDYLSKSGPQGNCSTDPL
ncbi:hypothetical protein [Chromobacterium sphagni]|uniref:Uncharacterized protein n=1 Tax=Chromobacterium sphagni TaxID=1903179 RepID=A0ABX3CE73_9NEIS|nr:hypothetical protein [Chromobacterium sphagni]OHX20453.1 hypothetical protein BI344_08265 [Chromobacterium sphagni]